MEAQSMAAAILDIQSFVHTSFTLIGAPLAGRASPKFWEGARRAWMTSRWWPGRLCSVLTACGMRSRSEMGLIRSLSVRIGLSARTTYAVVQWEFICGRLTLPEPASSWQPRPLPVVDAPTRIPILPGQRHESPRRRPAHPSHLRQKRRLRDLHLRSVSQPRIPASCLVTKPQRQGLCRR